MAYLVVYAGLTMAGVFGAAAALKIRRLHDFASSIVALELIPARLIPARLLPSGRLPAATAFAVAVVAAEALTAIACLATPTRIYGLAAAVVMLAAFAAVAERATRRPPVPCRCFGSGTVPLGRRQVARNALLMALAGAGLIGEITGRTAVSWPSVALCGLGAIVTAALVASADDLIDFLADLRPSPTSRPE